MPSAGNGLTVPTLPVHRKGILVTGPAWNSRQHLELRLGLYVMVPMAVRAERCFLMAAFYQLEVNATLKKLVLFRMAFTAHVIHRQGVRPFALYVPYGMFLLGVFGVTVGALV